MAGDAEQGLDGAGDAEQPQPEVPVVAVPQSSPARLTELAEVRQRHQERYREREEREEQEKEQRADAELAARLAAEEEEERKRQLENDEEYSRQLAAQLNGTAPGADFPLQDFSRGQDFSNDQAPSAMDGSETQYHQLEDGDGDTRAPMRTGYVDRLIDDPQDFFFQGLPFPPLLAGEDHDADPRQVALANRFSWRSLRASAWVPLVCAAAGMAAIVALMSES
eukprot:CAMPEP_0170623820 /NCGR_PEP_ID=MMETSP0224-20130122/29903_1 /TAXON_ID=285029 /ORGANISM="Togula jolla, Strain CCCM 725" /LENGTH=222 /DNA_ID=CAMNT_0010950301 /DNA_START=26 /DNA_END=694 /DNA_ORIENTATION=-